MDLSRAIESGRLAPGILHRASDCKLVIGLLKSVDLKPRET